MITYNDIDEARRKEKVAKELQKLPENFIQEVSAYLKEKKEFSSKNIENFSEDAIRAKKQFENARTLFKELILRRREKILDLLFIATETGVSKRDFENMLDFEKKMFDEMIKCIESTETQVNTLLNVSNGKIEDGKQPVVFLDDMSEFMDLDGNLIGPFKKGDKISLQKEIAKILVEDRKANLVL